MHTYSSTNRRLFVWTVFGLTSWRNEGEMCMVLAEGKKRYLLFFYTARNTYSSLSPTRYPFIGGILYSPVSGAAYIDFQFNAKTLLSAYQSWDYYQRPCSKYLSIHMYSSQTCPMIIGIFPRFLDSYNSLWSFGGLFKQLPYIYN